MQPSRQPIAPSIVSAARPAAILLWFPALGVPARKYQRFAQAMATLGISCAVHEWRGTGACPLVASRRCDWGYRELLCDDLPASIALARGAGRGLPLLLGGHSIGGQFAVLAAALDGEVAAVVPVASGVPHWRLFPGSRRRLLVASFARLLPGLTALFGAYPGHLLGFAGRQARQLMRDWANTVRHGHYDLIHGLESNMSARLGALDVPMLGLAFDDDWLAPSASLEALLGTAGGEQKTRLTYSASALGTPADHFGWMRHPQPVAETISQWWAALSFPRGDTLSS